MGDIPSGTLLRSPRDSDMAHSLQDPAFEPHASFMFDDGPDADYEFRNMQRNIASLNVLQSGRRCHHSMGGVSDLEGSMPDQMHQNFVSPFEFEQDDFSPHLPSWPDGQPPLHFPLQSLQADIVNNRSASVAHHFGQITPPDDATPNGYSAAAPPPSVEHAGPASTTAIVSSAKSERARNAANQRHAKAKKARKDSVRSADSPDPEEGEVEGKRERYREKNRVAAAKCRAKKKVNTDDLEESARIATARNNKLRAEERELRDMFSSLRDQALAHDPSQGCGCQAIHSYNLHKAHQTARGAMGLHGLAIPSPSMRSVDSASPVAIDSRTQSFSGMRPQFSNHQGRQSIGGTMGYGEMAQQSVATADMNQSYGMPQSPVHSNQQVSSFS